MDIIVDLVGFSFDALVNIAIFFAIVIALLYASYLYRSRCPACHKLRAAKHRKTTSEGGFFFGAAFEQVQCKYCDHQWTRRVNDPK